MFRTVTGEVTGFGSGLKHRIGRRRVRDEVEPFLLNVRQLANDAAPERD